jgi:hypothetical protein
VWGVDYVSVGQEETSELAFLRGGGIIYAMNAYFAKLLLVVRITG